MRERGRERDRLTDRQRQRQRDRETDRQRQRETKTGTDRNTETQTQRQRQGGLQINAEQPNLYKHRITTELSSRSGVTVLNKENSQSDSKLHYASCGGPR